jgi:hypothetical protein
MKPKLEEYLFDAIFDNAWQFKTEGIIPECVKIVDENAIEFGKWLNNQVISTSGKHYHLNGKAYVNELYSIYKNEKKL